MKGVIYTNRRADQILDLARDVPGIEWAIVWSPDEMARAVGDASFLVLSNRICTPELGRAIRENCSDALKWIHSHSAGIERAVAMGLPDGVAVTASAGAKSTICAEHAMTLLLALSRRLPECRAMQDRRYWARVELNATVRALEAETLAIIGLGGIGREVARKAKAFDMTVIAVSRGAPPSPHVDEIVPRTRMAQALGRADAVVIATASDASSYRLMDARAFAAMKPSAYLVNVARGEIVDEAALAEALVSGAIAGAALDVADPEPLDAASPLWGMENVIITPHVAAAGSIIGYDRLRALFEDELARFRAGRRFENQVDIGALERARSPGSD